MAKLAICREKLNSFFYTSLRLLLTFILITVSPLILLIYGVCLVYRFLVFKTAKYFDPSLGKMVSSMSNLFAAHDVYGNSYTVNIALHIAGKVDKSHLITALDKLFQVKAISSLDEGALLYPELKQRVVYKFGYTFWKNVEDFKVENHVHYYGDNSDPDFPITLEEIHSAIGKFGKTPLNPSRSPWEVYIVKNFVVEGNPSVKSAMILRLHHCMFDGYSVFNVFNRLADNGPLVLAGQEALANIKLPSWWLRLLVRPLMIFFRGPYELIGQLLSFDNNQLIQTSKKEFKARMRFYECEPFKLAELKEIKNHYKVTMSALVTTMVVEAVRKFMERRGITQEKMHVTFPLPILNHPDKLRNYFSGGIISLDMRIVDRVNLLQAVEKKFRQFRFVFFAGLPEVSMLFLRILGSLPRYLVPKWDEAPLSSTLMHSSFPGPIDMGFFCGFPVVDATVGGSISKPYPIASLCFSYNGVYKCAFMVDHSVFPTQEDAAELGKGIYEEFCTFQANVKRAQL